MDTLRAMRFFVRTVELGSLSAVARELGTTQPTVSKVLAQLESSLGARLLERSTKGPTATSQGLAFYQHAKTMLEQYDAALAEVQGGSEQPKGALRISAPVGLGQFHLNRLVQEFLQQHPGIVLELLLNDRFVDLVEEGIDVALRLGGELPLQAVSRHVAEVPRYFVASPSYVARRGMPLAPEELPGHDFIRFAWSSGSTVEMVGAERSVQVDAVSRYRVNNAMAIRDALLAGSGIGLCPAWLVADDVAAGALVRVFPAWSAPPQSLHILTPSRRYQPLRAKLIVQFFSERLRALPGLTPPAAPAHAG